MKKRLVLVVSLVVGLVAALATRLYVSSCEGEVRAQKAALNAKYGTIWALVYRKDVPAGTVLARGDLGALQLPALGMRGQALTEENLSDAVGRRTLLGHRVGDVVFWSDLEGGDPSVRGLSADIKRQMRAISINCTGAAAVSGMVRANDHVDVIGTFSFPGQDGRVKPGEIETRTILQNVLVLATGRATAKTRRDEANARGEAFATVTLEVTPREAEMIAFAEQMKGRLVLTLRNRNDTSYEKELPRIDFERIKGEIETLNQQRQRQNLAGGGR